MGFVVLPASIPDIRKVYDVYFAAFDGELVTQILFPWDIHNEEFRSGHTTHTLEYWHKDNLQYTYKCVDTDTDEIVGMSLWDFHWEERSQEQRKLPAVDWLEGEQKKRAEEFIRAFWQRKEELIGGRQHVYCHVVAVHPKYQRRGIGGMLTRPGMEVAEQLKVPLYLEATDRAVRLYEKLGFEKLSKGIFLGPEVAGGEGSLEAPVMVRMPSSLGQTTFGEWTKKRRRSRRQSDKPDANMLTQAIPSTAPTTSLATRYQYGTILPHQNSVQLSVAHGPSDVPLLDFKLAELLDFQCEQYGLQECLVIPWTGARWTYDFLRQESIMLARAMAAQGIRPGDRVGIMAGNCEQYVSVLFGCMRIGAILVITNNTYTSSEARYALDFTACRLLFTTPFIGRHDNRKLLSELISQGKTEDIVILRGFAGEFQSYTNLIEQGSTLDDFLINDCNTRFTNHDVCNLQFTSGTTGHPKAAMLTHHSILNNSRFIGDRMNLTDTDTLCCPPPLFHCFGLVLGLLATLTHGGKIVYPSETFDAAACLQSIPDEQCTAIHGVPAMFDSMFSLPRPSNFDSHRLRTGIIAGAPVPKHLMELLVHEFGMVEFTSSYGLTEASPTCFNAYHNDPIHKKLSTVGHPMPYVHVKIVDRAQRIVPIGTKGELCIAGYQLQKGYWNNRAKTDEVMIRDETGVLWLHTGDEAVMHEDGSCSITGRYKEIIIRGGENIYPLEIEERLVKHSEIERAIVVGVKHKRYGEVVAAFLQRAGSVPMEPIKGEEQAEAVAEAIECGEPEKLTKSVKSASATNMSRLSDEQIRDWVREKLGRHKAPAHIFWLGEDGVPADVPLTGSGKVRKFEMAKVAERSLERRDGSKL
ncbi:putative NRPS-like protein biosynthetic cluster [Knufia fluminis]|uniref:NRPS-like protein biosynthetic cluster n=1 Tax=Knufia fluminis TaxID=191047 RepID=A0AAN8I3D1_9EURO|nr:putative NRPS-like protein biosynthetic cluster [Knufia fluminis]